MEKERKSGKNWREWQEKGLKLLEKLKEEAEDGIPVVVEGINDEKALKGLGVSGTIVKLKGKHSLSEVAEKIASKFKRAIILTDADYEGRKLAAQISKLLEQYGSHPDLRYLKMTRLLGKTAVEQL